MLKGISPVLSPQLLSVLYEMGHGDEIVLADAHFPGETLGKKVLRADGLNICQLLDGILPLFELDSYSQDSLYMMAAVTGDQLDTQIETNYKTVIEKYSNNVKFARVERFDFYEQAKKSYCIVMTGDTAKYANIILKKGVTPVFRV